MKFQKIIITVFLLCFSYNCLQAQGKEEAFIKASYVINFVEEIIWPNEGEINEFNIGVLNDPNIYSNLKELSKGVVIRGKKIKVTAYNVIPEIKKADLLVLSEDYSRKFMRYDFLGNNCLVVSSNNADEKYKMVNFYTKEDRKVQFELNTDYLKTRGFVPSVKLLVFGGQSTEVLGAFSESEAMLKQKVEELRKRNAEVKEKELRIWKLGQEIAQKEADIILGKNDLEAQETYRRVLNTKLEEQKELVEQYNADIKKHTLIDKDRQNKLVIILNQLKSQKSDIDENNEILTNQKEKISQQKKQLVQKDSELKNSMIVVVFITLVLLLVIILFYLLYRSNQAKKKVLKIIEEQNEEIIKGSHHKDEFIANMSHEIRTPLNAIVGFTNLLIAKAKLPQNKNYLNKVLLSSNNLLNIINDILDISKIESGKMELEAIDFDLLVIIQNIFYSIDIKSYSKNLEYKLTIDDEIPNFVNGDPTKIGQIILNLLSNAVKFTNQGTINFDVNLVSKDENQAIINFKISDTGIGISKERIEAIFEKFTQEDVSVTRKHGGTGLGLSITKNLVKLMDGEITAESVVDKGSVFSVLLTLPIVDEPQETITESDLLLIDGIENIKLIFADDHDLNRESVILQFKQWNNSVEIDEAKDGADLVRQVQEKEYDVILTDIRMPIMSGIEATQKIREEDPHVIIIGLSANATPKAIKEGIDVGMDDYLTKPIQFNKLLHSIATHVNLPYKVIKRDFLKEEELLSRLEGMSENRSEFIVSTKKLVQEIDNQIEQVENGDYKYDTIHSLLNKVIYIGSDNLMDKTRSIQEFSVEERDSEVKDGLKDLKSDWNELKKEITIILESDEN